MNINQLENFKIAQFLEIILSEASEIAEEKAEMPDHIHIQGPLSKSNVAFDMLDCQFDGKKYIGHAQFSDQTEITTIELGMEFFVDSVEDISKNSNHIFYTLEVFGKDCSFIGCI